MGHPGVIRCPESMGGCGAACVEVGHVLSYPKFVGSPWPSGKDAEECRYACPHCGKEWNYQTKWKDIYPLSKDARFHIRIEGGRELIRTDDADTLTYWGLPSEEPAELTPEQVLFLEKRAATKQYERSKKKKRAQGRFRAMTAPNG
jgi:hypothetical protein